MTFKEAYASLKRFYKSLMFPKSPFARSWTMKEIDEMDINFYFELTTKEEQKVYIDQLW